jgi:hypothetical protein
MQFRITVMIFIPLTPVTSLMALANWMFIFVSAFCICWTARPASATCRSRRRQSVRTLPLFFGQPERVAQQSISVLTTGAANHRLLTTGEDATVNFSWIRWSFRRRQWSRGRAEPSGVTRHQSMHRKSRDPAERRADGTSRIPTIACRPGLFQIRKHRARRFKFPIQ